MSSNTLNVLQYTLLAKRTEGVGLLMALHMRTLLMDTLSLNMNTAALMI